MSKINLYDIYRKVTQRKRAPKSAATQRKAEAMCAAADCIIDKPTLAMVKEFRKAEKAWLESYDVSASTSIADQFEDAIRSKNFVSERSHFDPRGINGSRQSGLVYCARSASKPDQLKIGHTTIPLKIRLQKIAPKHGIEPVRPLFAIRVSHPAEIEEHAKIKLRDLLVAGRTKGDSNEWYRVNAIEFARAVVDTVEERGNSVDGVTLFADCPNTGSVKAALNRLGVDVKRGLWL